LPGIAGVGILENMIKLIRYWFEFEGNIPIGFNLGCGVTAWNYEDALNILKERVFKDIPIPNIKKLQTEVDVSLLDAGHVLPNMLPANVRGIWFPMGYNH
jgi:hypothetical protein